MAYDFKQFKTKTNDVKEWLKKELSAIRTGRANAALLDGVRVNFYGAQTPLIQTATIISEDARTLRINPYDKSQAKSIEKGIADANLGISVVVNDAGIRVIFPELTAERREILVKQAKQKLEEARISLRKHRDDMWNEIQAKEKQGGMGEDEKFRNKDEMQKIIDETGKQLEDLLSVKEKEIKS